MKKPLGPEAQLLQQVLCWIEANRYEGWRVYTGPVIRGGGKMGRAIMAPNPNAGFPDIELVSKAVPGILFTFELKSTTGIVRPEQKIWHARLQRAGIRCAVVRSLEEFRVTVLRFELEAQAALAAI